MSVSFNFCALVLFSSQIVRFAYSDLTLDGTRCGSKICNRHEYCSDFDRLCKPCSSICEDKNHNYDPKVCVRDCQDYIHDIRYIRHDELSNNGEDLKEVVEKLHYMVTVCLTLICFVLIILFLILCLQVYRWKKRNNVTWESLKNKLLFKKSDTNPEKSVNNSVTIAVTAQSGKPDLRLEMPPPGSQSETSPVTVTTSISRRPVEDCNLDYAYDNPVMSKTPSPNSKAHESTF